MEKKKGLWANLEEYITLVLMGVVTFLVLLGFVLDFLAPEAVAGVQKLSFYVYAWCVFLGVAVAIKHNTHMKIDILYSAYPERVQKLLSVVIRLVMLAFCVVLTVLSFQRLLQVAESGQVDSLIAAPMALVYLAPAVGFLLSLIRFVEGLIRGENKKGEDK